jgi:hypothetical protein
MAAPSLPAVLRAGADGLYAIEAATGLIIAHGMWPDPDLNDAVQIPEALCRRLEERLAGARGTSRFLDKRIDGLEARILAVGPEASRRPRHARDPRHDRRHGTRAACRHG